MTERNRIRSNRAEPIGSQLRLILLEEIRRGHLVPGGRIPSERELARSYGISRASVRDSIAQLITEGVLLRAGGKGTFVAERPPKFATRSASTHNIAFIANRNVMQFFQFRYTQVLPGVEERLREDDYHLVMHSVGDGDGPSVASALRRAGRLTVDGCIIAGKIQRRTLHSVQELGVPIVILDRRISPDTREAFTILADYATGTRSAIQHLSDLGHTQIGFVGFSDSRKYRAYCQSLKELGLPYEPDFVEFLELFDVPPAILAGYQAMQNVLSRGRIPSALLVTDDAVAIGVMEALNITGIEVPSQISVVCFDDLGQCTSPPLTRIRFDRHEAGRRAASTLLRILEGDPPAERQVLLPVEFLNGKSTAPPPSRPHPTKPAPAAVAQSGLGAQLPTGS